MAKVRVINRIRAMIKVRLRLRVKDRAKCRGPPCPTVR